MSSTEVEPYRVEGGQLVTTGDVRQDLRNATTDSWTSVVADVALLAGNIAPTDFVPKGLRNNAPAVTGAIMYGREVGLPPMTALQVLHNIDGRVSMSSEGQRALVLQAGHEIVVVDSTSAKCTIKGRRKGSDEWTQTTWTIDDARQAGLVNKDNWKKYPKAMLVARASADLCRLAFPDVIRGLMAVEELEDVVAITTDAPAIGPSEPTQVQRKARKKQPPAPRADAPEEPLPEDAATPKTGEDQPEQDAPAADSPALPEDEASPSPQDDAAQTAPGGSDADTDTPPSESSSSSEPPSPDPDPDEVVDAEIVEDAEPRMTPDQRPKMMAGFTGLGVKDKAERMQITVDLIGREVTSANELSMKEASSVIDSLEQCTTRDELEAIIQATVAHREKKAGA